MLRSIIRSGKRWRIARIARAAMNCAMDGAEHIVEGVYESSPLRQRLMPQHPHWAEARALDTTLTIEGEIVTLVTRVGAFA